MSEAPTAKGWWKRLPPLLVLALTLYVAVRVPVEVLTVAGVGMLPPGPGAGGMPSLEGPRSLHAFLRWDSGWYVRIIREGYVAADCTQPNVPCPQANIAFMPGYPMLVRGAMKLGLTLPLASFLVTHAALVLALWGLLVLARQLKLDDGAAERSAVAMLAFPSSIFLSAGYAEVIFLALGLWGLVFLERKQVLAAGVLLALGAVTRSHGLLLLAAAAGASLWRRDWRAFLSVSGFGGAVVGAYLAWQHVNFGDALAFMHARRGWGFVGQPAMQLLSEYWQRTVTGSLHLEGWLDFASVPFLGVTAFFAWRRLGLLYGLYATLVLAVPLSSGQVWALSRIALCAFPGFLLLGLWTKDRRVALALLAVGLSWLGMAALRLGNGLFIGT